MSLPNLGEPPIPSEGSSTTEPSSLPPIPVPPGEVASVPFSRKGELRKQIIDYQRDAVAGLDKCPKCGGSEAAYDIEKGVLVCTSCRYGNPGKNVKERFGHRGRIDDLDGYISTASAAAPISDQVIVTVKCQGCGAEVAVNTAETLTEKCHWCRQVLSLNNRVPNGAVPDGILPFRVTKETAMHHVQEFVKGRWFFALNRFKAEFKSENVYPVYLPYGIADARFKGELWGEAELHIRDYKVGKSSRKYDYDLYNIYRSFGFLANDIPVEASSSRQVDIHRNTNNVLQAVQPFPIEDAVDFKAQYLHGFHSERRDMDTANIDRSLHHQLLTILRGQGGKSIDAYKKRGVRWDREEVDVEGVHLASIYLPIWLYAFVEKNVKLKGEKKPSDLIHYIAVNGVTGKTMGSIPVNKAKLRAFSAAIGVVVGVPTSYLALIMFGLHPLFWMV